jgi:hypothetical protein
VDKFKDCLNRLCKLQEKVDIAAKKVETVKLSNARVLSQCELRKVKEKGNG